MTVYRQPASLKRTTTYPSQVNMNGKMDINYYTHVYFADGSVKNGRSGYGVYQMTKWIYIISVDGLRVWYRRSYQPYKSAA